MNLRIACLLVAALAGSASADTKSFTAVKSKLPGAAAVVVGIDLKAVRAVPSFPKLLDALFGEARELKLVVDTVKSMCAIDAIAALSDVTVVADLDERGVVVIGLNGLDEPKLVGCINKILEKQDPKSKLTGKPSKPGKVTEYKLAGEHETFYAAWLAKDVVAVGMKIESRETLDAMLAGKPASGELATMLGKTNPNALAFGGVVANKDGIKGGHGTVQLVKGSLVLSGKIIAADANTGAMLLAEGQKELARTMKRADKQPPIAKVLKAIKIAGAGAEIAIDVSLPEADLPALIPTLDKLF